MDSTSDYLAHAGSRAVSRRQFAKGASTAAVAAGVGRPTASAPAPHAPDWQEQVGIIGPRLDLDVGPQVEVAAGATSVTISGVAEPGARVSINGTPVELDRRSRFAAEVPVGAGAEGMIVVSAEDYRGATTVRAVAVTHAA